MAPKSPLRGNRIRTMDVFGRPARGHGLRPHSGIRFTPRWWDAQERRPTRRRGPTTDDRPPGLGALTVRLGDGVLQPVRSHVVAPDRCVHVGLLVSGAREFLRALRTEHISPKLGCVRQRFGPGVTVLYGRSLK